MASKKRPDIYIDDIAKLLPVDTWFNRKQFVEYSGIAYVSTKSRLKSLVNDKHLQYKQIGKTGYWLMTAESMVIMLERGKANKEKRGKNTNKVGRPSKPKVIDTKKAGINDLLFKTKWV